MVNVAVLGYGTVGSGVVEVIERNNVEVSGKCGEEVHVKYILDLREFPGDPYEDKVVHDFQVILEDREVSVVCEVMGGIKFAYPYTKQLLEAGKSVCTSNKELVAKHGAELLDIAEKNHCSYLFEASVGGGIPIIRTINHAMTPERIEAVAGILNGTTNYILTKMEQEGTDYAQALKQAQDLGYAERNPQADVEGHDACRKTAILASLMTGRNVDSEKIFTEGITEITTADFAFAKGANMTIKLLGTARLQEDGSVLAMVAPHMIAENHSLAMVNGVFNGIFVTGNMLGDIMLYGHGAGKLPTASAVTADVVDCVRNQGKTLPCHWEQAECRLADVLLTSKRFFVRVKAQGCGAIEEAFPGSERLEVPGMEVKGYFTPVMTEKEFEEKYSALSEFVLGRIRVM